MAKKIQMFTDGGARGNPGPAAIGILLCDEKGQALKEHGETIGENTNNVAEYMAVIVGLELASKLGVNEIDAFSDSLLVVSQLNGKFKIKTPHIRTLFNQVQAKLKPFSRVSFTHVRREHPQIQIADGLVNEALDNQL